MNRFVTLLAALLLAIPMLGFSPRSSAKHAVVYDLYTSYFVKNNSGLTGAGSHLVLTSQPDFDRVFGPAAVMGKNSFLPEHLFDKRLVVATILHGNLRHYTITAVDLQGKSLRVAYTVKEDPPSSAQFSSPLILSVDRGTFQSVIFVENGQVVATVPVG